jgi:hypothetical protein
VAQTEEVPRNTLEGETLGFQQWWTPEAFDAVADTSRTWSHEPGPRGDHEHCLIDAATIGDGGQSVGWRSGWDWVCCACYQRYFLDDHLGIRGAGPC